MGKRPLKMTRSKQSSRARMRLANLVRNRHTVLMAFSPGVFLVVQKAWSQNAIFSTLFGCGFAALWNEHDTEVLSQRCFGYGMGVSGSLLDADAPRRTATDSRF